MKPGRSQLQRMKSGNPRRAIAHTTVASCGVTTSKNEIRKSKDRTARALASELPVTTSKNEIRKSKEVLQESGPPITLVTTSKNEIRKSKGHGFASQSQAEKTESGNSMPHQK